MSRSTKLVEINTSGDIPNTIESLINRLAMPLPTEDPQEIKNILSEVEVIGVNVVIAMKHATDDLVNAKHRAILSIKNDPVISKYTEKERFIVLDSMVVKEQGIVDQLTKLYKRIDEKIRTGQSFLKWDGMQLESESNNRKSGVNM